MSSFAQPGLQALLLCSDDTVVRVLRRVLTDLEIGVEHCTDLDSAVQKLTRQRFEAVIVDCTTQEIAAKILKGKRATSVRAIKDDMENAGVVWEDSAVVVDGNLISSRTPADLPQFCKALIAALRQGPQD